MISRLAKKEKVKHLGAMISETSCEVRDSDNSDFFAYFGYPHLYGTSPRESS